MTRAHSQYSWDLIISTKSKYHYVTRKWRFSYDYTSGGTSQNGMENRVVWIFVVWKLVRYLGCSMKLDGPRRVAELLERQLWDLNTVHFRSPSTLSLFCRQNVREVEFNRSWNSPESGEPRFPESKQFVIFVNLKPPPLWMIYNRLVLVLSPVNSDLKLAQFIEDQNYFQFLFMVP